MSALRQEISLSWQFVVRDLSSAFVPPLLFMIAAWSDQPIAVDQFLLSLGRGALLFAFYVYTFCVANQINGLEEDLLNKPYRPLAAGIVSLQGVQIRWLTSMMIYTALGWQFGVLEWVLLWQAVTVLHNFWGWSRHWFTKNLSMALGIIAQLACAWQLIAPTPPAAWRWILLMSVVIFSLVALQDLRDIVGDRAIGRRTLPLVLGETRTRGLLALGFALLPLVLHFWLLAPAHVVGMLMLYSAALAAFSWIVAARVWLYRTPHADHRTYMLFTYIYCAILATAIVAL
jgi:4-hydroxybenzoate polyprenyltransferase